MSNLLPCHLHISTKPSHDTLKKTRLTQHYSIGSTNYSSKKHEIGHKSFVVKCCGITSPLTNKPGASTIEEEEEDKKKKILSGGDYYSVNELLKKEKFEYLMSEYGWKVRRLNENDQCEMREVAQIQAEAFHTPMALFDDRFFQFFKAEVLSGLLYKLRNSPRDRYVCLVAESARDSLSDEVSDINGLVGVVDVTVLRDKDVLQHLNGAEEYLYISGIAVSKKYRRRKIASVLLKACDAISVLWNFEYLALRVYNDDLGARELYAKAGYRVVSSDPVWLSWTGRRRRVLMVKQA